MMFSLKIIALLLKQLIFNTTRFLFLNIRCIIRRFDDNLRHRAEYFETSAQVERIIWRSRKDPVDPVHPKYFLSYHLRLVNPSIVLQDNVTLISVNDKEAFFLEYKNSIHHYTADTSPFCWITLFQEAKNLITMPISSFHRIAESLGPIETPCAIISHPGRTGSTLMCKLLQLSSKRILVLSEPETFSSLTDLQIVKNKSGQDWDSLVKSTVRLVFKPVSNVDVIVIKERLKSIGIMKDISKFCPEIKHIYMQRRDNVKTVQSWQRCLNGVLKLRMDFAFAKYGIMEFFMHLYPFDYPPDTVQVYKQGFKILNMKNEFEYMLCFWANFYKGYIQSANTVHFNVLYYDDLINIPEREIRKIFELLNVQPGTLQKALEMGLKGDSQKDTLLSRDITWSHQSTDYTGDVKRRGDLFLDSLGLPRI